MKTYIRTRILLVVFYFIFSGNIIAQYDDWRTIPTNGISEVKAVIEVDGEMYTIGIGFNKSTDGGETWQNVTNINNFYGGKDVWMTSKTNGIAIGYDEIFRTTDAWQTAARVENINSVKSIFMINENVGWAAGSFGYLYKTTDNGQSWILNRQDPNMFYNSFNSVSFNTPQTGHIVGENIYKTSIDGGNTWQMNTNVPDYGDFRNVYFFDANNGWIIGGNGLIFNTSNGGNIWQKQTSNTTNTLTSISFINSQVGYAVGENGTVMKTTNSGSTWITVNLNSTNHFRDVLTKSNGEVWIVGTHSQILTNKPAPQKINLTTSVFPVEAAADGCTITPSGTNQYDLNTNVSMDANAGTGWVWDKWSGSLSGSVKPQTLIMDADKNVVANFQPILNLALTSPPDENHCLPNENEEITIATAKIFVDGVDWQLTGITFSAVEKFKSDFTEAWIEYSGIKLKGTIATDSDGFIISIAFTPNQIIQEGTTLDVRLFFMLSFPSTSPDKYIPSALSTILKYKVSIHVGQVQCVPIPESAKPGVKTPVYPPTIFYSNILTIASIWNVSRNPYKPFSTIKEAIESNETQPDDLIRLCPGLYLESVAVDKPLTIFSSDGYERTIWQPDSQEKINTDKNILTIKKSNTKIFGISFMKGSKAISLDAGGQKLANIEIKENYFQDNTWGIFSTKTDSSYFFRNILCDYLTILNGVGNVCEKNSIQSDLHLISKSSNNTVKENIFGGDNAGLEIDSNSTENNIIGNTFGLKEDGNTEWAIKGDGIQLAGKLNIIESNIISNCMYGIILQSAKNNIVRGNIIGLNSDKTKVMKNMVGIFADKGGCSANIIENNIICGSREAAIKFAAQRYDDEINVENIIRNNIFGLSDTGIITEQLNLVGLILPNFCNHNLIEANTFGFNGVVAYISGNSNRISNNKFGTDISGSKQVASSIGVVLSGEENMISSNIFATYGIGLTLGVSKNAVDPVCRSNYIISNKFGIDITGNNPFPIAVGILTSDGAKNNIIEENAFGEITSIAILLTGIDCSENWIRFNSIGTNKSGSTSFNFKYGISLSDKANRNLILFNTIGSSSSTTKSRAIIIDSLAEKNTIRGNYIGTNKNGSIKIPNYIGVDIYSNNNNIIQNKIWYNYAGIVAENCKNYIAHNDIRYSKQNTGIHLVNSSSNIFGNTISFDEQDGIKCEQGSNPIIVGNNIFSNKGFALNNADPNVKINALGNYWGTASGPGASINGNINASSWLNSENKLILSSALDTLFIPENGIDSLSFFYTNWLNSNDKLNISITSNKENWITSQKSFIADLSAPNSGESKIKFVLPAGTAKDDKSQVVIKAVSQSNSSLTSSDTVTVMVYQRKLNFLAVRPDTISCSPGDTLYFGIAGFDQHRNEMTITDPITWSANGGSINNSGRFVAGSSSGIFHITATDIKNNIKSISKVKIGNSTTSIEENKNEELPATYSLSQNYPNPFNPVTTIKYSIPSNEKGKTENVMLIVYDILGREVEVLVNLKQSAGNYEVKFDGSKIASGVYFYKLQSGSFVQTKKFILLK